MSRIGKKPVTVPAGPVRTSAPSVMPPSSERNPSPSTVPSTSVASCRNPATKALFGAASSRP